MNFIRAGLCLLFVFCVFAFGAVEVWSQSVLEIGTAILLVGWAFLLWRNPEAKIEWNPLMWPLVVLLALGVLQYVFGLTAYRYATRTELLRLGAYIVVFFLVSQAFRTRRELTQVAWFLICFAFLVAVFGITQHFTSENRLYWFRELPFGGDIFGPYVNRNHFAGFVELTVPIGLSLMVFRGIRRDVFPLATLLAILPVSGLVLSGSRGGILSFAFEMGVLGLLVRSRKSREGLKMGTVGIVALAAVALIVWIGAGTAIERFSLLSSTDPSLSRRFTMVRAASQIVREHPILGSGLGTLVVVYPRYETVYDGRVVEHVHNDYMELLAETGVAGGLCGLVFIALLYRQARNNFEVPQGHFSRGLHAGAIVALSGLFVHSFVDFNLHIPANTLLFLLQAQLACSAPLPSEAPEEHHRRNRHAEVAV